MAERVSTDPMLPRPFRVASKSRETADTYTLVLEPSDASEPIPFAPGQFNMLYAFGVGEAPISMSGDPAETGLLVHTIRRVGAVTRALCAARKGDVIGVRGPFGSAWPLEECHGDDVLLVAGGIGLAPLRPAFQHLLANRRHYGRITLLYGTRTPADLLYRRQLEHWRGQFGLEVEATVDNATGEWFGPVGVVTRLLARIQLDRFDTAALLCGPEVMMRFCIRELEQRGLAHERIHVSLERNMQCAIGFCGHCQLGPEFICKDGPVFPFPRVRHWLGIPEA